MISTKRGVKHATIEFLGVLETCRWRKVGCGMDPVNLCKYVSHGTTTTEETGHTSPDKGHDKAAMIQGGPLAC